MAVLIALPYSPWSEKARWALDYCQVPYQERVYVPLVGELALRRRLGQWVGKVSVPVLLTDDGDAVGDSYDIALWADAQGTRRLFPEDGRQRVARYNVVSERGMSAGRALSLGRVRENPQALEEVLPRPLRRLPRGVATQLARAGVTRTQRKYPAQAHTEAEQRALLADALDELRAALAHHGEQDPPGAPRTVLGSFSYADIVLSQLLCFVHPPARLPLGEASRTAFEDAELRERYADLVAWRDALYGAYR